MFSSFIMSRESFFLMCYVVVIRSMQFKDVDYQVSDPPDLAEKQAFNIFLIMTDIIYK